MFSQEKTKNKNFFQELVQESIERKYKLTTLRKSLLRQSQQLIDDTLKNKITLDKEELFKASLPSFLKAIKQRDIRDVIIISLYLVQMKKFMRLFGEDFTSVQDVFYYEQLKRISSTIIYEKFHKNRIVVKYGDEGKKFFLILKGEVQVILPTKKNVTLQLRDFKRYLLLLYIYKEYEMLKMVIKENKAILNNSKFKANYIFFQEDNTSNNNNANNNNINNTQNSNPRNSNNDISKNNGEEENKDNKDNNNYFFGYKDYKFGFNKIENKKSSKNLNIENNSEKNKFKEINKVKFLKKLMKHYLTDDEIAYYERTKNINLKEVDDGLRVTPIDYINRIIDYNNININYNPKENENDPDSDLFANDEVKSNYLIYEYKRLIELQAGDIFGDLALTGSNVKRTATIISVDDCHFACLTRELYSVFIEKGNERIRNNKINYLLSINILRPFPRFILEKKLFNHFGFKNFIKDKYLLKTNEISNDIIFLKDGIFEVSFCGKLGDLTNLINLFYREYINLSNRREREDLEEDIISNVKIMEYQKHKIESIFQRFINEEFSYILFLVNAPSIFGFRETESKKAKIIINEKKKTKEKIYVYHSNICVKCNTTKGEYIYIDKNIFYKHIYGTDSLVQEETKLYVLDFLRKILKRLLNIRYTKLWNLFLSIGVDKNLNTNINFEKMQQNEDIYKTVNKLLSVIKEGQIYSNEISKYMNDYFDNLKKIEQNQKQQIKVVNQNYQKEKFKKIIGSRRNQEIRKDNLFEYKTNRFRINSTNLQNIINLNMNSLSKNEKTKNGGNKKLIREKFLQNKESISQSLNDLNFKTIKLTKAKRYRSSSANITTNPNSKAPNTYTTNARKNSRTKQWYFLKQNQRWSSLPRQSSLLSTASANSYLTRNTRVNNSPIFRMDNITKGENNKFNDLTWLNHKWKKNDYKTFYFSDNRPNTSKSLYYYNYFNYSKKSKEKYTRERINYIIKNTRILFTKTKNLDKIVRIKRINSVG